MKEEKNNISRRNFIGKSVLGTSVILSGSLFGSVLGANRFINSIDTRFDNTPSNEGVFPFYKYAKQYNFGEFIPKDQGGKFVQMETLSTEDDKEIVKIINQEYLDTNLGSPNDWSIFEKTELEKSVWFNRFYYLPSFARLYYIDKNKEHLIFMMDLLKNWIKENPMEGPSKSKYNWFDMQVAWRSINLSWCYYLAKDGLSEADKKTIYDLQAQHAKILIKDFGKKELNEFNHQSHGALAILYLAILFPALPEAPELLETGIRIINHHADKAFYDDGGNVEQMFGYYPFMTSVFRDSYLLFKSNNVGEPEKIYPLLKKMYRYLSIIKQPDGTVPPINDSYEQDTKYILASLVDIISKKHLSDVPKSILLPDSEFAVMRSRSNTQESWYINLYAAKLIGAHDHAGRLAVNFWFNKNPIFVDSGCCNYDNPLLVDWYRRSEAHNTVLIDGKSDFLTSLKDVQWAAKRFTDNKINKFISKDKYIFSRMISPENEAINSGVKWTRDVALVLDKYLLIHDYFECDYEHNYETIFRYADLKVTPYKDTNRLLIDSGDKLVLIPIAQYEQPTLKLEKNYFGSHAKNILTPTSIFQLSSNGSFHSAYLIKAINEEADIDRISVMQEIDDELFKIDLTDEKGEKISMSISLRNVDDNRLFSFEAN
ncbi:MAG: heparinase II/III family protein [Melioribacteraceae bacterium]|nr:heparinase II/III family protein [Melioribacteraceae bacterium]